VQLSYDSPKSVIHTHFVLKLYHSQGAPRPKRRSEHNIFVKINANKMHGLQQILFMTSSLGKVESILKKIANKMIKPIEIKFFLVNMAMHYQPLLEKNKLNRAWMSNKFVPKPKF